MTNVDEQVKFYHSVHSAALQHRQFAALKQAVQDRPGAVVIELGAGEGVSTSMFLTAGGDVWSVDILDKSHDWEGKWHFLQADDLSDQALSWFPTECDVLFIDTVHEYEHTLKEIQLYAPRVKDGGIILLHDTQYGDNGEDLPQPTGQVAKALTQWCEDNNTTWENLDGSFGLGSVQVKKASKRKL